MIARIWRGLTPAEKADDYFQFLQGTGLADYQATPGNRGVQVLRQIKGDQAEFLLISFWESWEAIRQFAGDELDRAVYYPEDKDYLLNFEPKVQHYEVLAGV